jgi:large subunit ribosomal protein L6
MSRIGKKPIQIPQGVEVKAEGSKVTVKGPKVTLSKVILDGIKVVVADGAVVVHRAGNSKEKKARHGLYRALIANMIEGVSKGFEINLELAGVGYKAIKQGKAVALQLGLSHPVEMAPPEGIEIQVEGVNKIKIKGADKEVVGQFAADIRRIRPPEPYKGKGIKYAGEIIRRKAGKVAKVGGAA